MKLVGIHVAEKAAGKMSARSEVRAVAGHGLEGDRYFLAEGTFSKKPGAGREVTLIEAEAIEALARDYGVTLAPADSRRNLLTQGVPLNHFVGREFTVGEVRLKGVKLCEPCSHLVELSGARVLPGLVHRGGLRADIVEGGTLRVGDAICPA